MGSSTPGYKNNSYIRNSSIKRVKAPQTPINDTKSSDSSSELKGLLKINKWYQQYNKSSWLKFFETKHKVIVVCIFHMLVIFAFYLST